MARKPYNKEIEIVTWDDIDLDDVLGDYTESERELESHQPSVPSDCSSDDDVGKENRTTTRIAKDV